MPKSDPELLADWLERRHEPAFHALVGRYAGLVHTTARRTCPDESMAAEVSQLAFISLARKARSLADCVSLGGWLHRTTLWHATNLTRKHRRELRKRELLKTAMVSASHDPSPGEIWQEIQPVLDAALAALSAKDREALLLRFYRSLTVPEVAAILGTTTAAAQKRIDRATARLREKLANRGCPTAGTLAAALATGLAADASAAVPAVSILATKAIAAAAVGSGFVPAAITLFVTMKSASLIPPLLALTLSISWLGIRLQTLAGLEDQGREMRSMLSVGQAASNWQNPAVVAGEVTPQDLLRRAAQLLGTERGARQAERLLASLSSEEFLAAFEDISKWNSPSRGRMEELLVKILVRQNPGFAVEHLISKAGDKRDSITMYLEEGLKEWATNDPRAAAAWFDRVKQNDSFATKRLNGHGVKLSIFESALMSGLLKTDLDAASARLAALPENRREYLINEFFNRATPSEDQLALAGTIWKLLPESDALRMLERQTSQIVYQDGFSAASEFLIQIDATAEERATFAEAAAGSSLNRISSYTKITSKEVDELRTWLAKEAPDAIDRATGTALSKFANRTVSNFSDISELAVSYHEKSGNDDVLCAFLMNQSVRLQHPAETRILAGKVSDEQRREEILKNLK